eukprot:gene20107-26106_t
MSSADLVPLLQTILARLDVIESKIGNNNSGESSSNSKSDSLELPRSVKGFDSYTQSYLEPFVAATAKLGGDAEVVGKLVKEAWAELRALILKASACKEPAPAAFSGLLSGLGAKVKEINASVKRNEWEKHTKTVSEGLGALNWVAVKPAPRDFIESFVGGSDYWANGIRKEYRTTNPDQIAFCDTFKTLLLELMAYVKEYHTTGLTWNPKGVDVSEFNPESVASKPTPTPPASKTTATTSAKPAVALFSALNKGENITSGLKTVTKDMQTWRSEYKGADVPTPVKVAPKVAPRVAETVKGPPKLEFQDAGSKWVVENQSASNGVVTIQIQDKKETVYIFGCIGATISVKGKCKSIVVDSSKKTKLYFDTAMASVEVVNSQRMEVHCLEKVPSVAIDKTDGIVVNLPASSLDSSIVASKSSEMNVAFPDESGDVIERPIPEQYVHRIVGKSVTAEVSDLYGH